MINRARASHLASCPVCRNSLNNILSANLFPGADIGAKINAAFASQAGTSGSPMAAVEVDLSPNQNYSYGTTFVLPNNVSSPYIVQPVLDCKGATLTYTGSGDGFTIQGENAAAIGEMRNCWIVFSNSAATAHLWSRVFFKMTHNTFNLGLTGITIDNDLAHGGPGYTEEQHWSNLQFSVPANGCGITAKQDPSIYGRTDIGSFFYNFFEGIHYDLAGDNSSGLCTPANTGGVVPSVTFTGGVFIAHANSGRTGDAIINLGSGSSMARGFVVLTGENDGGSPTYDVYAAGVGSTFYNFGHSYATGFSHGYGTGVPLSNISWIGGNQPITDDLGSSTVATRTLSAEPQSINASRMCGNFEVASVTAFLLANGGGVENDCQWEVAKRSTSNTYPDVDQAGTSGNPIASIIYTDSLGNVGIGPGWSGSHEPSNTLSVNGSLGATSVGINGSQQITGVQGTTGTKAAATSGTFVSGNLRSTNATGDEVDGGLAIANVFADTGGVMNIGSCTGGTLTGTQNSFKVTGITGATSCILNNQYPLPKGICVANTSVNGVAVSIGSIATYSVTFNFSAAFSGTLYGMCF